MKLFVVVCLFAVGAEDRQELQQVRCCHQAVAVQVTWASVQLNCKNRRRYWLRVVVVSCFMEVPDTTGVAKAIVFSSFISNSA